MFCEFGRALHFTVFGGGEGEDAGIIIDGLPAGDYVNLFEVREFMARRTAGRSSGFTNFRAEKKDDFAVVSGLVNDTTCGAPLCAVIPRGEEADDETDAPHQDPPSLLAALCFGGGVCRQLLEKRNITVGAHIESIGQVQDKPFDPVAVSADDLRDPGRYPFPTLNFGVGETMQAQIDLVEKHGDTIGGVIEGGVIGLPGGYGGPIFDGIENALSRLIFALPGVTAVEFGAGFRAAKMKGSEHNDAFIVENGAVKTASNNAGGILGGISTGMPLLFRAAVEPPPLPPETESEDSDAEETTACTVPSLVPVVESVTAMTVLNLLLSERGPAK